MISDVLSDACDEIDRYLRQMPETYAACLDEVLAVRAAMDTLRRKLDNPVGHFVWDLPLTDAEIDAALDVMPEEAP
jgi:hypothetical protein